MHYKFIFVIKQYLKIAKKKEKSDDFNSHQNHPYCEHNQPGILQSTLL